MKRFSLSQSATIGARTRLLPAWWIITRRELRDTLTDWRLLTPIMLLSLALPALVAAAALVFIRFTEQIELAVQIIPFAILLVGFLPSGFSLILALESFAGERERNTLETLLAMPLGDRQLYIAKLTAALALPLLGALLSQSVFGAILRLFAPDVALVAFQPLRWLLLLALVVTMALVMVSGAVIISSHVMTVRAASLLSSLILVPLALIVQLIAFLIVSDRWDLVLAIWVGLSALVVLLVQVGMRSFSREELLAREQIRRPWFGRRARPRRQIAWFSGGPIWIIARRELIEITRDWRSVALLAFLAVLMPVGLAAGIYAILPQLDDPLTIAPLIPFGGVLAGFVPISFALVAALESFVGERERNTFEALCALPVTDQQLFLGKLVGTLLIPLVTALATQYFFYGLVAVNFPALYAHGMLPEVVVQVGLLTVVVAVALVTGAVSLSIHAGSVREASLLASGILLPTTAILQIQAPYFIVQRFDVIWLAMLAIFVVGLAFLRNGLQTFQRAAIFSRSREEMSLRRVWSVFRRCFNEYQPAGTPLYAYAGLPFSPQRFYRYELPALLRELRLPLAVSLLAAVGGGAFGFMQAPALVLPPVERMLDQIALGPAPSLWLALFVFLNNIRVSILSNLLAPFSLGVFPFLVPATVFAQIGYVCGRLIERGGVGLDNPLTFLVAYLLPHGLVELPTFLLSAALGLRMGASLLTAPGEFTVGENLLWAIAQAVKVWLLVIAPLVLVAALIEGLFTPLVIGWAY
ncbi:ABC transporter permease subunit [Chloroflexus sp.]|uniref:stage II sporulation protein M n=1 Tax=Chloroflexus sp. TaxID=1904827 RepID=UPI00298F08D9|nr:stage II sporulation protein M [Chloroflexus sp.]MDW8403418.1 stage II sporulation protein M [Chloroflexus sp.]